MDIKFSGSDAGGFQFDPNAAPKPKRERKPRKSIGSKGGRIAVNTLVTLLVGAVFFYVQMPAINLHAEEFYGFVLLLCVTYCICALFTSGFQGTGAKGYFTFVKKQCTVPFIVMALMIVTALVGGVLVALFGQLIAGGLMGLLNVPEDVYPLALSYLRIYLLGMPVILLYNFEAAIFRSIGDTKMPLAALTVSGILNVILNLFFVIVLKMNVNGVAIATVLSNAVSSVLLLRRLLHGDLVRVELRELRIDRNAFNKIMRIGLPAGIQTAIFSLSNIIIQSAINSLGTVVMAASSAAFNIEIIAYDVLNSFSQACTTFVGQNYGAGKIDRCKKTMFLCLIEDFIASAVAIALVLLTGKYILAIFNSDPEVIAIGYTRLLFLFGSYIFTLTYEILSGYLRGFGISLAPAILTLFGVCGVRIFWIKAIFPMHRTFRSILLAYPISLATTTVLIIAALLICRPAHKFAARSGEQTQA